MKNEYDLIIIGSGPAGLSAATYSARYKLNTLVIGKLLGGTAGGAYEVHNFPSYEKIMGYEIMDIQQQQNGFEVLTKKEKYFAKKVILATGTERTKINLPMEKELTGRGVSYCATCDGVFYKDKIVAVVGGSDSALMASLLLAKFAKKVYIIYRQDSFFRGEPATIKEIKENKKIVHGFFAAGDVTNNPLKQIVTACAEGAIATYSAYQELDNKK